MTLADRILSFQKNLKLDIKLPKGVQAMNPYQDKIAFSICEKFYKKFYISAVSPLGFVKEEKNLNYYNVKGLPETLEPFIVNCLKEQLSWGVDKRVCYSLGEGENFKYINKLNAKFQFFSEMVALPHPRFIMQYRRKRIDEFVLMYKEKFMI